MSRNLQYLRGLMLASSIGAFSAPAAHAAWSDTVQAPTGYFVPTDAQKYDAPYYRGFGEDWDWTHSAYGGSITTATLNISAFDVDADSGEVDNIYVYDDGVPVLVGSLAGASDIYSFTTFNLGSNFYNDIAAGLHVSVQIDADDGLWFLTLAKSTLAIDGAALPPPDPGVPEPASWAMMVAGFGLVGGALRSRRNLAVTFV